MQLIPINPITRALWLANAYNATLTRARYELVFRAELPPLGWNTYHFRRLQGTIMFHIWHILVVTLSAQYSVF